MSVKVYKYINAIAFNGYSKGEMLMPDADYILKSDYDKLEARCKELEEELLGKKSALYMLENSRLMGKTTSLIIQMISKMRPNSEIKVTCPDTNKLESENRILKAKLEKAILHSMEFAKDQHAILEKELDSIGDNL